MLFKKSVNLGVVLSVLMTVVLFALSYLLNNLAPVLCFVLGAAKLGAYHKTVGLGVSS